MVPLREAIRVWAKVALLSFGGPAGQIAVMHRTLVEEKRWISEERFLHALNYCMLLPGPEAQQLAIYIGWLLNRTLGGVIAGTLFVLPGFVSILGLSVLYAGFHESSLVNAVFYGLKPAVVAVVVEAVVRIGRRTLKDRFRVLLAALSFVAIFFFQVPFPAGSPGGDLPSRPPPPWKAPISPSRTPRRSPFGHRSPVASKCWPFISPSGGGRCWPWRSRWDASTCWWRKESSSARWRW